MGKKFDIRVYISFKESICIECGKNIWKSAWITLDNKRNIVCLACSDLDHLIYLPAGDAALTLRARKHSTLSAIVYKWSSVRKRNERQGILVEQKGLELGEKECLSDEDIRKLRRERDAVRRAELDLKYVNEFAAEIRKLFPGCPDGLAQKIAEHACLKYSGRVGRTAFAKDLSKDAIILAVRAKIRHTETNYDILLIQGYDRIEARREVNNIIENTLSRWKKKSVGRSQKPVRDKSGGNSL